MSDNILDPQVSGAPTEQTIGETELSRDIDALFGQPTSDSLNEGGTPPENKDFGELDEQGQPDYTGMNHEDLAKLFQSRYDKAQAELTKVKPKVERAESLESFINELYENQEVRRAFLAQVEPDLVKPKDPYVALEEQLKKEFGEDFLPDDNEAKKPFTESWRYYKKLDDLYSKINTNQNTQLPKTLEVVRAERKATLAAQKTADDEMKQKVLSTMKWQENDYKSFAGWVYKLSALDLAKIYNFAQQRRTVGHAPSVANQSGSKAHTPSEIASELNKFFG